MEELIDLRQAIEQQRYGDAITLLGEMEGMSREDKIEKIDSFLIILLLHLIKQDAEKRTTRSWDASIRESARRISRINKRRKLGGFYLSIDELTEAIEEAFPSALIQAALEAFEGQYLPEQLATKINKSTIQQKALELING
ncbi:DUF29 family protein [Candidatus Halobeggiatoa sp. HSG11]|nr:DUF29 family protein [Candidatus Halobeggiatoa sp. HSG11]